MKTPDRTKFLKVSKDINPESIRKAHAVLRSFSEYLAKTGSIDQAATRAAAQAGVRAEIRQPPKDTKDAKDAKDPK